VSSACVLFKLSTNPVYDPYGPGDSHAFDVIAPSSVLQKILSLLEHPSSDLTAQFDGSSKRHRATKFSQGGDAADGNYYQQCEKTPRAWLATACIWSTQVAVAFLALTPRRMLPAEQLG
jgi:hypothetical protein